MRGLLLLGGGGSWEVGPNAPEVIRAKLLASHQAAAFALDGKRQSRVARSVAIADVLDVANGRAALVCERLLGGADTKRREVGNELHRRI